MNELLNTALAYEKERLSVIPIQTRGKSPLLAWEPYQNRVATEEEINAWWTRWPDANVGIVTGAVSGLVVIDIDATEAKERVKKVVPKAILSPHIEHESILFL